MMDPALHHSSSSGLDMDTSAHSEASSTAPSLGETKTIIRNGKKIRVRKMTKAEAMERKLKTLSAADVNGSTKRIVIKKTGRRHSVCTGSMKDHLEDTSSHREEDDDVMVSPTPSFSKPHQASNNDAASHTSRTSESSSQASGESSSQEDFGLGSSPNTKKRVVFTRRGSTGHVATTTDSTAASPSRQVRRTSLSSIQHFDSSRNISSQSNHSTASEETDCLLIDRSYYSKPVFVARFKLPVILIQSFVRGCLQREVYHQMYAERRQRAAVKLQARVRAWLIARKFQRVLKFVRKGGTWDNSLTTWSLNSTSAAAAIPAKTLKQLKRRQSMAW